MNRKERRKLERQGKTVKKEPVINIKPSDIKDIKNKAVHEVADTAFLLMLAFPLMILRDKYGYGKVRCERFVGQVLDLYESFDKGYIEIEDLHKTLWEEGGVKLERDGQK